MDKNGHGSHISAVQVHRCETGKRAVTFLGFCVLLITTLLYISPKQYTLIHEPHISRTIGRQCALNSQREAGIQKIYDANYFQSVEARMLRANTVVFNRVPKCASSATRGIYDQIALASYTFNSVHSFVYNRTDLDTAETRALIDTLKSVPQPWIFERHLHFVKFSDYGMDMPMYVNMVRAPVERFVSQYYFHRFEHPEPMSGERRNRTFDECVLGGYGECSTEAAFVIVPYFCGQHEECRKPSRAALERAKRNVDHYYGVIGIAEDLESSYRLFETAIPQFFTNMTRIARVHLSELKAVFKTHKKPSVSEAALTLMKTRLNLEYEFYEYVKSRYFQFLKHYQIRSSIVQ